MNTYETKFEEAANTKIYALDYKGHYEPRSFTAVSGKTINLSDHFYVDYVEPYETDLLSFMQESLDETTSPRGVEARLQKRDNQDGTYTVFSWGVTGNIATYETEEEADNYLFECLEYDFNKDDQRDTCYYETEQEAEEACAEAMDISYDTYKSYMRHMAIRDQIIQDKRIKSVKEEKLRNEEKVNSILMSLEDKSGVELLKAFFQNEVHPAPNQVYALKEASGLSWNVLRNTYKS